MDFNLVCPVKIYVIDAVYVGNKKRERERARALNYWILFEKRSVFI